MIFDFPDPVKNLSLADVPIEGCTAYLLQGEENSNTQMLFMTFKKDTQLPEHSHKAQWGVVLAGKIKLTVNGVEKEYSKGDNYFIPSGVLHSAYLFAGYSDITYFDEGNRYKKK